MWTRELLVAIVRPIGGGNLMNFWYVRTHINTLPIQTSSSTFCMILAGEYLKEGPAWDHGVIAEVKLAETRLFAD